MGISSMETCNGGGNVMGASDFDQIAAVYNVISDALDSIPIVGWFWNAILGWMWDVFVGLYNTGIFGIS